MKKNRTILTLLVALTFLLASFGTNGIAQAAAGGNFTPGSYTAVGFGMGGDVELTVEFDETSIVNIVINSHNETRIMSDPAFERVPAAILSGQTLNVDTVTGATITSLAIIEAVTDAVVQAGVDPAALAEAVRQAVSLAEFETKADVIIIGGGGAGIIAALRIAELGGTSIVLEKLSYFGGDTRTAGGNFAAVDPVRQTATGLAGDSIELHAEDIYRAGDYKGSYDLAYTLAANALDGLEWLESRGMEFMPTVYLVNGSTIPRSRSNVAGGGALQLPDGSRYQGGAYMVDVLLSNAEAESNITLLKETRATALIQDGDKVVGVKATAVDGNEYEFFGAKGVIIATGGYYGNPELAMEYSKMATLHNPMFGIATNTGDGLIMAREIGAKLVNMEDIQFSAFGNYGYPAGWRSGIGAVIGVNAEGERFAVEVPALDKDFTLVLGEQPGAYFHTIFDQAAVRAHEDNAAGVEAAIESGKWFKADTLEELAGLIGVPGDALVETVRKFNLGYAMGRDEFGRTAFATPITTPPFYGSAPIYPEYRYSVGGLAINTTAEVLDENNEPIPGLFAAGEVCGGLFGTYRMSSHAIADIVVFGRIAAESVMGQ